MRWFPISDTNPTVADEAIWDRLFELLKYLYEVDKAQYVLDDLRTRLPVATGSGRKQFTQRDAFLIAYGDHVQHPRYAPLEVLHQFCSRYVGDVFSGIHLLPFYPFSSDDGYAVTDFTKVRPELGSWEDVHRLGSDFELMYDLPLNHVSASHPWFQGFLAGEERYKDYFITLPPDADVSQVVRARSHPLSSQFSTANGASHVWTTFSRDHIDLNYDNPDVLLEVIGILLEYVARGASVVRLDAVGFLWKRAHAPSVHMPETHTLIQVLRTILDIAAPHVSLVTETNVPHKENVSYFADGYREAQLVYNFALSPLLLHAIHTASAQVLAEWAKNLNPPTAHTTFLNFTASHDGIGLRPVEEILTREQIAELVSRVQHRGGLVSYRTNPDGSLGPYELNISYADAVSGLWDDTSATLRKFILTQAIMLALPGVPAIYLPSLFAAPSWHHGVEEHGTNRAINREKFQMTQDETGLALPGLGASSSRPGHALRLQRRLLQVRRQEPAFHPHAGCQVEDGHPAILALWRFADGESHVITLHNLSDRRQVYTLPEGEWRSLFTGKTYQHSLGLPAYGFRWLRRHAE